MDDASAVVLRGYNAGTGRFHSPASDCSALATGIYAGLLGMILALGAPFVPGRIEHSSHQGECSNGCIGALAD